MPQEAQHPEAPLWPQAPVGVGQEAVLVGHQGLKIKPLMRKEV